MTTEVVGLIVIGGILAIITLYVMVFTDIMFGKHERSEKWDEVLNQPPKPPQEE
jgi:hypothetical protein